MPISKEQFEALFLIGDIVPCSNGSDLHITGMFDDHIKFRSTETGINEISVDYCTLSDAFDAFSSNAIENPMSLFHGIASEYNKRAEQAKCDAEVDALWLSAIVCQIP